MTGMNQKIQTGLAAQMLGVSPKTVTRWAEDGTLPYIERIGTKKAFLFWSDDVRALARRRVADQEAAIASADAILAGDSA